MIGRLWGDRQLAIAVAPLAIGEGSLQQGLQLGRLQRLHAKQARAAQQRLVHFKERVFGGGADQGQGAVFHPGQQRILLGAVEAMHFIDEQGGAQSMALQPLLGRLHRGPQILDPRQHGIEAAEVGSGGGGDDSRQGGLAHAWWAMQDQIANPVGGNGAL